ncbi:hypothetical protein B0H13DRAFT_1900002 [Mycena leptocephala]|nr:hypothetical protein B0H13DRAFT_1900002 [Mycena leptocephala]
MDAVWAAFHDNKQIFIDLAVRKNVDVNKLHKLKHYTNSIRSRGTAAGFNTEATERLHIDLAKVGYKATNKAYIQEMATWLRRQESVQKFGAYLQWAVPGYAAQPTVAEDKMEEEDGDAGEDEGADAEADESIPAPGFSLRQTAHFPSLSAASISTVFHAPDFLPNLTKFLVSKSITPPVDPTEESVLPVYKHVGLTSPVVPEVTRHVVHDKSGMRPPTPGQFDTVLVRTRKRAEGESPIDGLGVARVRVIFKLPEHHGNYPDPLVYIDWFKPLTTPVANLEMYRVSLSTRMRHQKSEIIPITDIVRSCHLIPRFGRRIDPTWTSENVLDRFKEFYLNPYLRHHDFFLFRYSVDLYISRKAEAERLERERPVILATGTTRATYITPKNYRRYQVLPRVPPNATSTTRRRGNKGRVYIAKQREQRTETVQTEQEVIIRGGERSKRRRKGLSKDGEQGKRKGYEEIQLQIYMSSWRQLGAPSYSNFQFQWDKFQAK